jgi:hypothetical protein
MDPDLEYIFPTRKTADELIDAYFERVHVLCPFVHEGAFRGRYERFWHYASPFDSRDSWIATLNVVFAYGCEFHASTAQGNFLRAAAPFLPCAREIVFSLVFEQVDIHLLQAQLLLCHYLQGTLKLNDC